MIYFSNNDYIANVFKHVYYYHYYINLDFKLRLQKINSNSDQCNYRTSQQVLEASLVNLIVVGVIKSYDEYRLRWLVTLICLFCLQNSYIRKYPSHEQVCTVVISC